MIQLYCPNDLMCGAIRLLDCITTQRSMLMVMILPVSAAVVYASSRYTSIYISILLAQQSQTVSVNTM